jgi:hypothetical protein
MRKPKVDVRKLLKTSCCFEESMTRLYLIDALQLCVFPEPLEIRRASERGLRALNLDLRAVKDTSDLGLEPGGEVTFRAFEGGKVLSWASPLGQHLQHVKNSPSLVVHLNLIRAARAALPPLIRARHLPKPDNYIDTRLVAVEESRRLGFEFLKTAIEQILLEYCTLVFKLWGYALRPEQVRFTLNEIELAWDVFSPEGATLAAQRFEHAWKCHLANGSHVFKTNRLERGLRDGMLKAVGEAGEILKLYAKGGEFLRFEAQLNKDQAKRFLGERLDPGDHEGLKAKLDEVAALVFPEILKIQAEVGERPEGSVLVTVLAAITGKHGGRILGPLLTHGSVKISTPDSSGRDVLERLRAQGVVEIARGRGAGKGLWVLTPTYSYLPELMRRIDLRTCAEVAP